MLTLYRIAFVAPQNACRIGLLFTQKKGYGGAILATRGVDLESGASHIGKILCHTLVQCEQIFGPLPNRTK